jgi:hypothetical protein
MGKRGNRIPSRKPEPMIHFPQNILEESREFEAQEENERIDRENKKYAEQYESWLDED